MDIEYIIKLFNYQNNDINFYYNEIKKQIFSNKLHHNNN